MGTLSTDGKNLIKGHEGFCLKFYGDPKGYPTVGWGHLITKNKVYTKNTTGNPVDSLLTQAQINEVVQYMGLDYTSPITQSKADTFFNNDTASAISAVNGLSLPAGQQLSAAQFDALVSMTFNCGSGVLATSDVVAMLAYAPIFPTYTGSRTTAVNDACSVLVSKAFSYDRNLQRRRNEEATLFCKNATYTHKYPVYTL